MQTAISIFINLKRVGGKKKKKRKLNNLLDKEKSYMHSVPFNTLISTQVSLY